MRRSPALSLAFIGSAAVLFMAGCASKPEPVKTVEPPMKSTVEKFLVALEPGVLLDYQVEKKLSRVNSKACYAYITGTLTNRSAQGISRKSNIDVNVFSKGQQMFRDQSFPVADVPPGGAAAIEMVISPVHTDGCPEYDRISIALRKVGM